MSPLTVASLLGLATLGFGLWGLHLLVSGGNQRAELLARSAPAQAASATPTLVERLDARLRATRRGARLRLRLTVSGVDLIPIAFVGMCAAALTGGTLVTLLIFPWPLAVVAGAMALRGCFWWLDHRREQRRQLFVAQLPELARIVSNGTSAGLSMVAALGLAADELPDPVGGELRMAMREMGVGQSLQTAFDRLAERMPSREVGVLVSTLIIQQRMGGDVVRALQDMADTLDQRKDLLREVRTLMSGSVYSGYLVVAMGVGTIFILNLIQPGVVDKMVHKPIGIIALTIAGLANVVGFMLIRRVTRVET